MSDELWLNTIPEGRECRVREVSGTTWISSRLREMGFIDQAMVKVIRSDGRGLIVAINGTRLALSKALASKITVCF